MQIYNNIEQIKVYFFNIKYITYILTIPNFLYPYIVDYRKGKKNNQMKRQEFFLIKTTRRLTNIDNKYFYCRN